MHYSKPFTCSPVLSVIIPFSYRKGDKQCLKRLHNALLCFQGWKNLEVVLCDTSTTRYCHKVRTIASMPGVKYFHEERTGVFSPGQTRNLAVSKAQGRYLFFCDADLLCSEKFVEELFCQVEILERLGQQAFAMFPCLYLSEKATHKVLDGENPDYLQYWQSYFKGELNDVDGIAVASSCLLVERDWFLKLGGFRSEFAGHGCEDFELIHRLSAYYPVGALPDDYSLDQKQQFPADYKGFRRYYSYYSLPHLFAGLFLVHQWHARPLTRLYHRRRTTNEALFSDIMKEQQLPKLNGILPYSSCKKLPDFQRWVVSQMHSYQLNLEEYPGLFRWKQGVSKPSGSVRRKLRKLFLKPRQFFRDMAKP